MSLLGCLLTAIMASAARPLLARPAAQDVKKLVNAFLTNPKLAMFPGPALYYLPAGRCPQVVKAAAQDYEMTPLDQTAELLLERALDDAPTLMEPYLQHSIDNAEGPLAHHFSGSDYRGASPSLLASLLAIETVSV